MAYHAREKFTPTPAQRAIIKRAFPNYSGRKFFMQVHDADCPMRVESYWDSGSRSYFLALSRDGRAMYVPQNGTPFDGGPIAPNGVSIPTGCAILEHRYFGSSQWVTIHISSPMALGDAHDGALALT